MYRINFVSLSSAYALRTILFHTQSINRTNKYIIINKQCCHRQVIVSGILHNDSYFFILRFNYVNKVKKFRFCVSNLKWCRQNLTTGFHNTNCAFAFRYINSNANHNIPSFI